MNNELIPATGAHQSPADERDWTLASAGAPTIYPESCFIDDALITINMQRQIGCCVGCTFEEIVQKITGSKEELSYRFVYAICKALDGVADEGTYPSLAAKVIRQYGVPLAKFCPNDTTLGHEDFVYGRNIKNIPLAAIVDAATRKSGADLAVPVTLDGIKQAITYAKQTGGGVAVLRRIGDSYWKDAEGNITWDKNKILPIRIPNPVISGHEEFLTGYEFDPATGKTKIHWLNHWSEAWADNGRGWEYAEDWLPFVVEIRVVVPGIPVNPGFTYHWSKVLKQGDQGPDVVALQHALKVLGLYPDGMPFTGYFGTNTLHSVINFQNKYAADILAPLGLSYGTGLVGAATLKKLNALFSS